MPPASSRALPIRRVSHGTASAAAKLTRVTGRKAIPASSGVRPSTSWRNCVVKNQNGSIAPRKRIRAA
jgi:hypothetical protein